MQHSKSEALMARAEKVIPGGVNSPVRAFKSVGGTPIFFEKGEGAYVYDQDGSKYIDYVGSWGPLILGHVHPKVMEVLQETAAKGLSFGAPTQLEVELAELVTELVPSMEQVRMVSSGTEATMSALRLARGFTGRDRILKFEGCYHGHADSLLVKAGSGLLTLGVPSSPGIPASLTSLTATIPYNDFDALESCFKEIGSELAAVIIEPVVGNMNLIAPLEGYLEKIRALCDEYGVVFIIDEVMTGFRVHPKGAQGLYNVKADLTCLGKVIGGGMPVGAFGGRADIMAHLAPLGPVYQAGTLSGNPLAMAVGKATLELLQEPGLYDKLFAQTKKLVAIFEEEAKKAGITLSTRAVGSMFGLFMSETAPNNYDEVTACDGDMFNKLFHALCDEGVYIAPSAFEAGFVSICHTDEVLEETRVAVAKAFARLK
ncbi:MAG: glutamate-1-semialdehyde 2,1-aminomutase [Pseudomonadota bacterium]|nr:glutamate-1-semialdehyde 2,1-aminomutase [Pseudomonadota bacterium]